MREENIELIPKELRKFFMKKREYTIKVVEWNDFFAPKTYGQSEMFG
ncbi:MAG: hypothetical protein CM15mP22_5900 [Gammaproteobacteria bacterium]|nr:MAG: hypothetical protein CM15mP22_5900 [Gammaproteobacteria bacterium]